MRTYLIAIAAVLAIVAVLATPHRGTTGVVSDPIWKPGGQTVSWKAPVQSLSSAGKNGITPVQAQVSVVGLAFGFGR